MRIGIQTIHMFIGVLAAEGGKRVDVRFLTAAQPSQLFWHTLNLIVKNKDNVSESSFFVGVTLTTKFISQIASKESTKKLEIYMMVVKIRV